MEEEKANGNSIEFSNPIVGKLVAKGKELSSLFSVLTFTAVCIAVTIGWIHHVDAGETKNTIAKALEASNEKVAKALDDSNKNFVRALESLTEEQKKSTRVMQEIACLQDPAMRNRADAREFCKRIIGSGR